MFSQNIWGAELGLDRRLPALNPLLWLLAQPLLILAWETQLGIKSYYWGRRSIGDRVTVFTIMYDLGLGWDLRGTRAASSETLLGLNSENTGAEKHLSFWFGIYYCGFAEMSVPEVCSTSSAARTSCPQYFTLPLRRRDERVFCAMPLWFLSFHWAAQAKLFMEPIEGARLSH